MRRLTFVLSVLTLLSVLLFVHRLNILIVNASPDIYQGDLIITGNDVYVIENERFDINGSIIVQENATLVLNNAVINFTQTGSNQFNVTLMNPSNGNPRITANNATFVSGYWLKMFLNEGSLANFNDTIFAQYPDILGVGTVNGYSSNVNMSYSTCMGTSLRGGSNCSMFDSSIDDLMVYNNSNCTVQNSTLSRALINPYQVNFTASELKQGFFNYWKFKLNCSVIEKPGGSSPDLTLINTQVNNLALLFTGASMATIMASEISQLGPYDSTTAWVYNSIITTNVLAHSNAKVYIYDSIIEHEIESANNAKVWLVNSTSPLYDRLGLSEIFLSWYLDVHVIDSLGQDVPSANVTATDPNAALAGQELTDGNGWATLVLLEKMMNASGEFPVGNYTIEATYETYSADTTVNMTGNQIITLKLEDFVIPEFSLTLILPLFMIATLLAVIVYRRKHTTTT